MFCENRDAIQRATLALVLVAWALALSAASFTPVAFAQTSPKPGRLEPPASEAGVLNLNTASIDELTRLPGIGPVRARAVLELRLKLTRFSRLEDLMRVKGIGRKTFRKLQPLLRLSGATTLPDRAAQPCPRTAAGALAPLIRVVRAASRSGRA
jgi:competence ComEA-like helix-hairpin-helix protein